MVAVCVLAGLALRGYAYARNPSLWIDEAMLALNVVHRSPTQLLEPLDLNQGAPVGFLMLSKLAVVVGGDGEDALRFVPCVAALLGVPLFTLFAYRALPLPTARLAVALFALSPYLAGYAAEFKQYELDATVAAGLLALGRPAWRGAAGGGRLAALAAAGAVAVWCSHPAVFVLGGVGLAALADAARRGRTAILAPLAVVAAWLVSFAACYLLVLQKLGMNAYLLDYWAGAFLPLPPIRPGDFAWLVGHFFDFFDKPGGFNGGFGLAGLAGVCFLVGVLSLVRTDWRLLVALVTPFLLALLASGLRKYPFAGRLLLFAVPLGLALVAHGLSVIAGLLAKGVPGAGAVVVAAAFAGPVAECNDLLKKPLHAEDAREVIARCHHDWQPGDRAFVSYGAAPAVGYYHPRHPLPPGAVRVGAETRGKDTRPYRQELEPFRGRGRVWVILAHRQTADEAAIRTTLDGMGTGDVVLRLNDAVLMLYDLSER